MILAAGLGLFLWPGLLARASVQASSNPARRLEQSLRTIQALEADFDQYYYSVTVGKPLHEKGKLYFQKPDLMRWEYRDPEPKVFLYKDGVFSQYYPEDSQLIRSRLAKAQYESEFLSLLSGQKDLATDYLIESDTSTPEARAAGRLKLIPRTEGEYAWITIDPDPKSGLIAMAVLQDWAENRTEFVFSKLKENPRLKPSVFALQVPPDTEVIDEEGPPLPSRRKEPARGA